MGARQLFDAFVMCQYFASSDTGRNDGSNKGREDMEHRMPWYKRGAVLAGFALTVIGVLVVMIALHLAAMMP